MSTVFFRTQDTSHLLGTPERAKTCGCQRQVIDREAGTCVTCGKWPSATVDLTWQMEAWRNRKARSQGRHRPFREGRDGRLFRGAA